MDQKINYRYQTLVFKFQKETPAIEVEGFELWVKKQRRMDGGENQEFIALVYQLLRCESCIDTCRTFSSFRSNFEKN